MKHFLQKSLLSLALVMGAMGVFAQTEGTLTVDPDILNFSAAGGDKTFKIMSDTTWTVESDESWLTVSATSGKKDSTITVTATENTETTERTATVTVTYAEKTETIDIKQAAAAEPPTLTVDPTTLDFSAAGGDKTFKITSDTTWTVESDESWLTVSATSGKKDSTITVTATENTETIEREATITVSGTGVEAKKTIEITQAGTAPTTISVTDVSLNPTAATLESGKTQQLTATVAPENATNKKVSWSSSNTSIATVDATNGLVTAVAAGTATITVTTEDGDKTATCEVTVKTPSAPKDSLKVSLTSLEFLPKGGGKVFNIESSKDWKVESSDGSWLTVSFLSDISNSKHSTVSGSKDSTIVVTATENTTLTRRTGTITVGSVGVDTLTISVTQAPKQELIVSTDPINFSAAGERKVLTVASNTSWKASSSSVSWLTVSPASGSNNGTITVTATANTALTRRTGTITVGSVGVDTLTISVTQDAAAPPAIVPEEVQSVDATGNGTIALSLYIPTNATLTGSFEVRFPAGMTLDKERTVLSAALSGNFSLTFAARANNTWLIEIRDKVSRASVLSSEYRKIMDIAYKASTDVKKGKYDVTMRNLEFLLSDDTWIEEDLLTVPVQVTETITSVESVNSTPFTAYFVGDMLHVESGRAERITVYSLAGVLLYTADKPEGMIEIQLPSNPTFCIVRGSRSGVLKVVR